MITEAQRKLLVLLQESADGGAFAMACDGKDRKPAHDLDAKGFARWHGTNWGSSFWSITDSGRRALAETSGGEKL